MAEPKEGYLSGVQRVVAGSVDGSGNWTAGGSSVVLFNKNTQTSHTGDTVNTIVYTYTLPGGTMGPNGILRIPFLTSWDNNANNKTFQVRFNNLNIFNRTESTNQTRQHILYVYNRNSEAAQCYYNNSANPYGATSAALGNTTHDTTADIDIDFRIDLANAGDTASFEAFFCELIKP